VHVIKLDLVRLIVVFIESQCFRHINQLVANVFHISINVYEYCVTKCDLIWHQITLNLASDPNCNDDTSTIEIRTCWEQAATKVLRVQRRHFNEVVIYMIWNKWKERRNRRIFQDTAMDAQQVALKAMDLDKQCLAEKVYITPNYLGLDYFTPWTIKPDILPPELSKPVK